MAVNQLPFQVIIDPNGSNVDISSKVASVDSCKFQGTGRIKTASIMLEALEGAFITKTNGGATPQINEFEKIQIKWQDVNENVRSAIFEVDTELGQKTESGTLLPLELKGRERALQDMKTFAYLEFVTAFFAINFLIVSYNDSKGTDQPSITTLYPNSNPLLGITNVYDFTSGVSYYDALMHIIERLNAPTSSGGVGDFYSLVFEDEPLTDNLNMTIKVQGFGTSPPTVQSTDLDPTHSISYRIDSKRGNQVFVRGMPNAGAVPNGFHDFSSIVEEVNHYPAYNGNGTYNIGMKVISGGVIYEAIAPVPTSTPPPNVSYWVSRTFSQVAGSVTYSEWTNGKATVTKNSCSNPTNGFLTGGFDAPAFPDGNLVVRETFFFRDFVHIRSINDTTLSTHATHKFYLRGQAQSGLYRGFRILVDTSLGNPAGSFGNGSGTIYNDRFGRSFENAMVMYTGSEWIVFREPVAPEAINRSLDHCCVLSEGKVYEYNTSSAVGDQHLAVRKADVFRGGSAGGPFGWRDMSGASGGNDPFHHPKNITNTTGLISNKIRANQDISSYLTNSAVKIEFEFSIALGPVVEVVERVGNFFQTAIDSIYDFFKNPIEDTVEPTSTELNALSGSSYYDMGWWYSLPFPYPLSEFNSISEDVGDLYGLGTDPNSINNQYFGSLDIQNSTFSRQGKFGLNHDQVDDMGGPFTGLAFYFNFKTIVQGATEPLKGDIPFTITIYDDQSQVWRADFQYRHAGGDEEIIIPFSSFTVNRPSRNPYSIDTLLINLIHVPELEIRSIFQERRVRLITWQLRTSYDDDERYMPFNVINGWSLFQGIGTVKFEGIIDGLHLTKQPFVSSGVQTDRVINPDEFEATNTRNKRQLIAIATAEKQRVSHKFESYNYVQDIRCDLATEQSVFLEDADLVKFADRNETSPGAGDGDANTRKLVVMEENFTYNAGGSNSGALLELTLGKRLPV